jgi:uncharacterized membrane protein YbhN (UPF0104 family)/ubiquinone/menaquinone biosynthesis C-methylase UbiE
MIKKGLKFLLMLAGLLIIVVLLKTIGLSTFINNIKSMNPPLILLSLIPWFLALFFGAFRLKKILNENISMKDALQIYFSGFLLNYASFVQGFGAGAKVIMLKVKKVPIAKSTASVSSELLYDIFFSIIVAVIFSIYHLSFVIEQIKEITSSYLLFTLAIVAAVLILLIILLKNNSHVREYLKHIKTNFNLKNISLFLPITFLSWFMTSTTIFLFFKALNVNINIGIIMGGLTISFLLGLVSFIPGGLGVRDIIVSYIYSLAGVSLETAISVALFSRVYGIISVALFLFIINILKKSKVYGAGEEYPEKSKYFPYDSLKKYFKGKVLEIGCAEGNNTRFLKEMYKIEDKNMYCIEIDKDKLEIAKTKTKANFYLGDGRHLPFQDNKFDFVYCSEIIEHLPSKEEHKYLTKEINRVLKKGGHCIITTPNKKRYHFFCKLTNTKIDPTHKSELTYKEFKETIKNDFPNSNIQGVFGVFGKTIKFKTIKKIHSKLSNNPKICKALIAICKKD